MPRHRSNEPTKNSIYFDGLEVYVYRSSIDDRIVVDIVGPDSADLNPDESPRMSVYMNEQTLYENPPYSQG